MSYAKFTGEENQYLVDCKKNNLPTDDSEFAVRDKWIAAKRYSELIAFILENWESGNCDGFSKPFSQHLIVNKELAHYKRLWKGIIRNRLEKLWGHYSVLKERTPNLSIETIKDLDVSSFNQFSSNERLDRRVAWERKYTMDGIEEFIVGLKALGDQDEIEKQNALLSTVSDLNKPKPKPTTDKRKMTDGLFWELIEKARKASTDQFTFLDTMKSILEDFSPSEIRKFDKLLRIKAGEINTWEHWALAYIVRQGCGDDEFDYFRVWAVSKGEKVFNSIRTFQEEELAVIFDEDPQLEEFYGLAEHVYEAKTSDLMPPLKIKTSKLTGTKWDEGEVCQLFPNLCKLFNYDNLFNKS